MLKIFYLAAASILAGVLLAITSVKFNVPTGWVGGLGLIIWAVASRRRWEQVQEQSGLDPSGPERVLRLKAVGTTLLLGHLCTALAHTDLDIHVGQGNYLAIDSWTMIAAFITAGLLFQQDGKLRDERDQAIAFAGTQSGYYALIASMTLLLLVLGFTPPHLLGHLDDFTVANIMVALITLSLSIKFLTQLFKYAKDTQMMNSLEFER